MNDKINYFIKQSVNYLNYYFYYETRQNKVSFSDVYQILEEDDLSQFDGFLDYSLSPNEFLGKLYEYDIPLKDKKDIGQFYTNNNLVNLIIKKIQIYPGKKILEPSCGAGSFIVDIAKKIIAIMKAEGKSSDEILKYIADNIYCNDKDLIALKITEINILSILMPLIVDSFKKNKTFKMKKLHLYNFDFIQKNTFDIKFDLVIGNPPFITLYGKRSRNMTEEKRAYYNTFKFVQNKTGNNKFNTSMFFVENGLDVLKEGGELTYILDIAFFETAYIDLRKYIVENYKIKYLFKGLNEFEDVASGQIILSIQNIPPVENDILLTDFETGKESSINQIKWNDKKNKYKFFFPLNDNEQLIINKVERGQKLGNIYPRKSLRTCCALTGRTDDFIVKSSNDTECKVYPYIEGSKGLKGKFCELTPQRLIKYDYDLQLKISDEFKEELEKKGVKNKKRVTLGDDEAYDSPKIFIRQSAKEIICTYTEKPYAANNSIYILTSKSDDEYSKNKLKYVCGILNSDLISYYCRLKKIIRYEKGKTPQIKISDLKTVGIIIDEQQFDVVVDIVEKLLNDPSDAEQLKKLNSVVNMIYNIDENEYKLIVDYLSVQ